MHDVGERPASPAYDINGKVHCANDSWNDKTWDQTMKILKEYLGMDLGAEICEVFKIPGIGPLIVKDLRNLWEAAVDPKIVQPCYKAII